MQELLERIKQLNGPCRYTDAEIAAAIGLDLDIGHELSKIMRTYKKNELVDMMHDPNWAYSRIPAYTSSVDAALTLLPEGHSALIAINPTKTLVNLNVGGLGDFETKWYEIVDSKTPPIAICIASIKAIISNTKK